MGGGTGIREGKLSLGSWDPASDHYHPSTKHQQTLLWGLTHPGAVAWPRNQVCSAVLPRESARAIAGARSAHRVTAQPRSRVIDARGSLEVRAPPARPSAQPTAHRPPCQSHHRSPPDTWREKGSNKMESQREVALPGGSHGRKHNQEKIRRKESIRGIKTQSPLPSALGWQAGPVCSLTHGSSTLLHQFFRSVGILCIFFS